MKKKDRLFDVTYFEPSDYTSHLVFVYDNLKLKKNKKITNNRIVLEYSPSVLLLDEYSFFEYFNSVQEKTADITDVLLNFLDVFIDEVLPFEATIKSEISFIGLGSSVKEFKFSVLNNDLSDDEEDDENLEDDLLELDFDDDDDDYIDVTPNLKEEDSHLSIVHHNEKKKNAHKENSELKLVDTSSNAKNKNNKQNKKKIDPKKSK